MTDKLTRLLARIEETQRMGMKWHEERVFLDSVILPLVEAVKAAKALKSVTCAHAWGDQRDPCDRCVLSTALAKLAEVDCP